MVQRYLTVKSIQSDLKDNKLDAFQESTVKDISLNVVLWLIETYDGDGLRVNWLVVRCWFRYLSSVTRISSI